MDIVGKSKKAIEPRSFEQPISELAWPTDCSTFHLADKAQEFAQMSENTYNAVLDAYGQFNSIEFSMRLSPKIHETLGALNTRFGGLNLITAAVSKEEVEAQSTFFHETIHWWQHVGSSFGLMLALNHPVQTYSNMRHLKIFSQKAGLKKSVLDWLKANPNFSPALPGTAKGEANIAVNNHYDLLSYRLFCIDPSSCAHHFQSGRFESVSHAFHIAYANTLSLISGSVDKEYKFLPDPRDWGSQFSRLKLLGGVNHRYGDGFALPPITGKAILEGQAAFNQYIFMSRNHSDFSTLEKVGAKNARAIYREAFEWFLKALGVDWPERADDPLVLLFLYICDFSINPKHGFPFQISCKIDEFYMCCSPSVRFMNATELAKKYIGELIQLTGKCERENYFSLSEIFSEVWQEPSNFVTLGTLGAWFQTGGKLERLWEEYTNYTFGRENYPVRYLLGHFFAFQRDKFLSPHLFCWPGLWGSGDRLDSEFSRLFDTHAAPFIDKADSRALYARSRHGIQEAKLQKALDEFYSHALVYQLTDQWIARSGKFDLSADWLVDSADKVAIEEYCCEIFSQMHGFDPRDAEIL